MQDIDYVCRSYIVLTLINYYHGLEAIVDGQHCDQMKMWFTLHWCSLYCWTTPLIDCSVAA